MASFEIYSDGGASPNPGPGAWAVVVLVEGVIHKELTGFEEQTSNNRMELLAAINGLQSVSETDQVTFYTDSNYVRLGITEWIHGWKKNNWRTASKQPVKNQDSWRQLDSVVSMRQINWHWVKGHNGDKWNEYVDEMVNRTRALHTKR